MGQPQWLPQKNPTARLRLTVELVHTVKFLLIGRIIASWQCFGDKNLRYLSSLPKLLLHFPRFLIKSQL